MKATHQFYILTSGLSSIIQELKKKLTQKKANIKTSTQVKDISKHNELFKIKTKNFNDDSNSIIESKNIILTVTNDILKNFTILKQIKKSHIESVKNTPLTRIYSIFDTKDLWFKDTKKTTTTSPVQYIIPINEKEGSIMSSYTDMENAVMWHKLNQKSPKKMEEKLLKELEKVYDQKIPKPKTNKVYHWYNGVAAWQPNYKTKKIKKEIINPMKNIYIAGENYSNYQGWIEGALETSEKVLKTIFKNKRKTKKIMKGGEKKNKTIKIQNCCNHNKKAKQCKTKKRTFKLPRRFSRKKCLTQKIRGFSMKSSCTPYLNCKR